VSPNYSFWETNMETLTVGSLEGQQAAVGFGCGQVAQGAAEGFLQRLRWNPQRVSPTGSGVEVLDTIYHLVI
jgi:hypothetical protein